MSQISALREVRRETKPPGDGTGSETGRETNATRALIGKVLSRSQVRQPARRDVRQDPGQLRLDVRQIPETLKHPRDCPQWWRGCLSGCPWYHPETSDFCWRCDEPWWSTVYARDEQ
jgi:hypothetical protein